MPAAIHYVLFLIFGRTFFQSMNHIVRVGQFGHVGRFRSPIKLNLDFGCKVVCRTDRGLEIGEYLESFGSFEAGESDGDLLRIMTQQDELLAQRLEKNKQSAILDCQKIIEERRLPVVLMDADQTFDGKHLYFYFLGEITPEVEALTQTLAETYDSNVKFSEFAETLAKGCGPDCGTKDAENGCGTSGGCSTCSLKNGCKS